MSRPATWWLLAAAASAGLLGVVLKATDVSGPPGSGPSRESGGDGAPARPGAPLAADVDRPGRTPSVPPAVESDLVPASREPGSMPARDVARADGGVEPSRTRAIGPHRSARERASARRRKDGGSLEAGTVGDEADAPLASGSTRAAGHAAAPAAAASPPATAPGAPVPPTDVSFTSGEDRQFATDRPVEIADTPNLAGPAGTLSFWLQPTWQDGNQDDASLLELGDGRLRIVKNVDFLRFEWTDDAGRTGGIGAPIAEWKPGEWHAVTTTWNGTRYALYIDGQLVSEKSDAGRVGLPDDATLIIGSNFPENRPVAPGVIGKVDVRRRPLTPGEVANQFTAASGGGRR